MKGIIYERYGPPEVLSIVELPKPVPKADELLIRVRASTVNSADWRMRSLEVPRGFRLLVRFAFGIFGPRKKILGSELSGEVVAVGAAVTSFRVGDVIVAYPDFDLGCHVQYKCMRSTDAVAIKPKNLSFVQASALCFGGVTMLDFYRRAALKSGQRVLVNGASGTVGSAAVQLAKSAGAYVTAVCSGANADLVKSLGADEVVDYARRDFSQTGQLFDIIVDAVGNVPFERGAPALLKGGCLLMIVATLPDMLKAPWQSWRSGKKIIAGPVALRPEYLAQLCELATAGKFIPLLDSCYPFERIVDAHRYVDQGHKKGSVVIIF
jgi:NADPH:quinone reductase-like Zn-dependent oxidoreductase